MFHVGQKVVCVDDSGQRLMSEDERAVVKAHVYTIREIDSGRQGDDLRGGLRLVEIRNPTVFTRFGWIERWYHPQRFRPVRETDISIFTKLLDDVPLHVKERV